MRDTCFLVWARPPRPGRADLPRLDRLTQVGKSDGHQLASPADLPTKLSWFTGGTYRLPGTRQLSVVKPCQLTSLPNHLLIRVLTRYMFFINLPDAQQQYRTE